MEFSSSQRLGELKAEKKHLAPSIWNHELALPSATYIGLSVVKAQGVDFAELQR